MIVSKLKPVPFHKVNSPLVLPVRRRRPSGVHFTTLTGCFTLLSDEWRCRAGIESTGRLLRAAGGNIYIIVSGHHKKIHFKGTYIEDIAKTVTLRLKAPHTLILGPSVFEVPNICSADIRGIPFRFRLADVDGNTVMTGLSAQYRVVPMLICIYSLLLGRPLTLPGSKPPWSGWYPPSMTAVRCEGVG